MIGKVEADFPLCQPFSMFREYVVCELDPHASSAQIPTKLFPSNRFMSFPALWLLKDAST